jgi:7,8-dihydropterin-6-yl-methyl-4-(beta-D-ribofuranosyl)aminobenzene 5'-phosphate synthase
VTEIQTTGGWIEDTVPESQSLVLDTTSGLVVVSGCGHAGIINTVEYARDQVREVPVHAVLGGFHLLEADGRRLEWTGRQLRAFGIQHLLGAHCTGIEAVFRLREHAGLDRKRCVVGAVGASFELSGGIDPLDLAR